MILSNSITHGMRRTRFYNIWTNIKTRTLNKNCKHYSRYGGRGIYISKRWLKFENFKEDMYDSYIKKCADIGERNVSIDRKCNLRGYYKYNCQWSDIKTQCLNRRSNRILYFKGQKQTVKEWALQLNVKPRLLHVRLSRDWSIKETLLTPVLTHSSLRIKK